MSKDTDKNLFIVSSMPRFYQQLFSGVANYSALGNRIIQRIKAAHVFRQTEQVKELARILINIPITEYRLIAEYYFVWCKCRDLEYRTDTLERIIEQSQTYKTKALFSRGAVEWYQGKNEAALYFYKEALKTSPTISEYIDLSRTIAVLKATEGFHKSALRDLERLIPFIRHVEPRLYYDFLNSYALELGEAGRKDEARNISRIVLASPFIQAYPEWQETANDLREPNRSFVAVPSIKHEYAEIEEIVSQLASEAKQPDNVVPFKLKEAPEPTMPEPLTPQENRDLPLSEKREMILAAMRASELSEFEYDKLMVLFGLLKGGPAEDILDLEDEQLLDDIIVIWADHIGAEALAGVLSALRDCDDSFRRNELLDRMIRKAFDRSHLRGLTEEAWRLRVERRLPKK